MRGQEDTGKGYRKGRTGDKILSIWGEQPVEKGVRCEGQSVEPGRLTESSGLPGLLPRGAEQNQSPPNCRTSSPASSWVPATVGEEEEEKGP